VSGRNRLTYQERIALDVRYVRTWTIWTDISILVRAIPVVLLGKGAY
jgi:lipopolysaccharide/colanic/teichoic acid biosynthesis glycosyltransferase